MYAEEVAAQEPATDLNDMSVRYALLRKFMELPKAKQEEYVKRTSVQKTEDSSHTSILGDDVPQSLDCTQLAKVVALVSSITNNGGTEYASV